MGGYSGSAMASHAPCIKVNGLVFAVSKPQSVLAQSALVSGGTVSLTKRERRSAEVLKNLGAGKLWPVNEDEGEWVFQVDPGVQVLR